jgi:hypothetical protein
MGTFCGWKGFTVRTGKRSDFTNELRKLYSLLDGSPLQEKTIKAFFRTGKRMPESDWDQGLGGKKPFVFLNEKVIGR